MVKAPGPVYLFDLIINLGALGVLKKRSFFLKKMRDKCKLTVPILPEIYKFAFSFLTLSVIVFESGLDTR